MEVITFTRMIPDVITPMPADKAALGYMPTSAFQYCEPMRAASSHGWYLFPPTDILLSWNGANVFYWVEDGWQPLIYAHMPGYPELWDSKCPDGYQGLAPPYLRALPAAGAVQVWSGWLMEAVDGWSGLVRPLVNVHRSNFFYCFEAVIEIDRFRPCPIFVNLQLRATDTPIHLTKVDPLFQLQPVRNECYAVESRSHGIRDCFGDHPMSSQDWNSFRETIRSTGPEETHRLGDYGAASRKRAKANAERDLDSLSSAGEGLDA